MEKDPCHDELTLQTAGVFPSESCDGDILGDKSETDYLPKNTREDTEMLEQQNSDKANIEVSCVDKMSEVLYDDNNTLEKNTICGGIECHLALLDNKNSEARSNAISSPMQKRHKCTKHYKEQHEQGRRKDICTESLTHMRWRHSIAVCTSPNLLCLCSILSTCSLDTVAAVLRVSFFFCVCVTW
uniref:Uncharacterized protein n=1 Tax=Aegilops tauschii subsp. strangulata TaxID=200361 RepID=A0A452XMG7_AEGTS